jgi:hypothetical protein
MKGSSESATQSRTSRDLTKSEIEDLREAFNIFDINGDGEWANCEWNNDKRCNHCFFVVFRIVAAAC